MKGICGLLALALLPAPAKALTWFCEYPVICAEGAECQDSSESAMIVEDGEYVEIVTSLEQLTAISISDPERGDTLYVAPPYYGITTLISVFSNGESRMTVHTQNDEETYAVNYVGSCDREGH